MPAMMFGGVVYRSMVHTSHCMSVAGMISAAQGACPLNIVGSRYMHSSNLPQARSLWLLSMMRERPVDYALTIDSDTGFDGGALVHAISRRGMSSSEAIGIVPVVRQYGGSLRLNAYVAEGEAIEPSACGGRPALWAGGFGLALFNLSWFREHWPSPRPEQFGPSDGWLNQGEDIQMCRSVVSRGGTIVPIWVPTVHYDSSGSHTTGQWTRYSNGRMEPISQ